MSEQCEYCGCYDGHQSWCGDEREPLPVRPESAGSIADLEVMTRNRDALRFCLERLVYELPTNRDWLDPDLEKQCETVLRICN